MALSGGVLCTLLGAPNLWGYIRVLFPSGTGTKIPRALSPSVVSATVPDPYLPEPQTQLTGMVDLLGRCPELCLLNIVALLSRPTRALSLSGSVIRNGGTVPGGEYKLSKTPKFLQNLVSLSHF